MGQPAPAFETPEFARIEIKMTGRAGLRGVATTFVTRAEWNDVRRIERNLNVRLERQMVNAADKAAIAAIPERIAQAPERKLELVHKSSGRGAKPAAKPAAGFAGKKSFGARPRKFSAR